MRFLISRLQVRISAVADFFFKLIRGFLNFLIAFDSAASVVFTLLFTKRSIASVS